MSRYVRATIELAGLDEVAQALAVMGIAFQRAVDRVMLRGSLECTGEPVALRCEAGTADAIEDFGFVVEEGRVQLVCGEVDRDHLTTALVPELLACAVQVRVADVPGTRVVVKPRTG